MDEDTDLEGQHATPPDESAGKQKEPASKARDWEASYKGLQKVNEKLQAKLVRVSDDLDAAHEEIESLKSAAKATDGDKQGLVAKIAQLEKEKGDLERTVASHKMQTERTKLILSDFPELASFEASGLLPMGNTPEEMKEKLAAFKAALETTVGSKLADRMRGAGPKREGKNEPPAGHRDAETIFREINALAGSRDPKDREKYDQLQKEYMEAMLPAS